MSEHDAIEFFARILPQDGLRCATLFAGKRVTNHFFTSNAELARFIFEQDALGHTVYHACASYKASTRRSRDNVGWLRALWLDIDVGLEAVEKRTGYATLAEALHALALFCR